MCQMALLMRIHITQKHCSKLLLDTSGVTLSVRRFVVFSPIAQNVRGHSSTTSNKNGTNAKSGGGRTDRELFLSILNASATRRDAKSYLSRFNPSATGNDFNAQQPTSTGDLHVALIKIRAPQDLDENVINGVAQTLSHLGRLGLRSIVVPDCTPDSGAAPEHNFNALREMHRNQAGRIMSAIESIDAFRAIKLDDILEISSEGNVLRISSYSTLVSALAASKILVVPPVAYTDDTQRAANVSPNEVMLALTRRFVQSPRDHTPKNKTEEESSDHALEHGSSTIPSVSVDKIILLDPFGGLPSASRPDKSHVFVNLEQEYQDIRKELQSRNYEGDNSSTPLPSETASVFGQSNPFTQFAEQEIIPNIATNPTKSLISPFYEQHIHNLDLLDNALGLLPSSSSALLTSAAEAAILSSTEKDESADLGVGTRSPKNPLIFNLLTDKPLISSSLPVSRLKSSKDNEQMRPGRATFLKRGMSVTMIPDPRTVSWEPPTNTNPSISLAEDPRIDFSRLLNLIEDSFGKSLDVKHYLNRVQNRFAGVIVAGEYEGGALLTWELPPGAPDDGSEESRQRMVPYLDKFAVLKRSQGAGGVADILFSAMVRSCFPNGVCWRSRKDNPVNKWYFELARGTWKLPDSNWTMFWTTQDLMQDKQKLLDYAGVCRSVGPSWADRNSVG